MDQRWDAPRVDLYRTPDSRFADLVGFPYEPGYADVAGLRMAWVEAGPADGPTVVLLHGQPTWSYLYRTVIPVLTDAGVHVVAPDLVGFGRSDKPTSPRDYSYARHVAWTRELLFEAMDLREVTLVGQDWGGLIGLRLVAEHPERFARVVATNTGLPTGHQKVSEVFRRFRDYVASATDLPVGAIVRGGCLHGLSDAEVAAYDAPFPEPRAKAGARVLPSLVPASPDDPAADDQRRAWESLAHFDKPFLCAFSDGDPITRGADAPMRKLIPGSAGQPHCTITGAGHFVQEDAGERLGTIVRDFMLGTGAAG